jgi:hypothetical protein
MSITAKSLSEQAMQLPPDERLALVDQLLDTIQQLQALVPQAYYEGWQDGFLTVPNDSPEQDWPASMSHGTLTALTATLTGLAPQES